MRGVLAAVILVIAVSTGCSDAVSNDPVGDGLCEQETRNMIFGITYSTDRSRINCDTE